jgi:hypothetical protein
MFLQGRLSTTAVVPCHVILKTNAPDFRRDRKSWIPRKTLSSQLFIRKYQRGLDLFLNTYSYLDVMPLRQEEGRHGCGGSGIMTGNECEL